MKILARLEKSKQIWFLIVISLIFFLLRLPSLIEPYWYGDEGMYEVIGQALYKGRFLYTQIWDHKPPLLYLVYALFNGDQFSVKFISLLFGLLSVLVFFYLSQKLFKKLSVSIITTSIFTLLFASPYLEGNIANAENFMLLPIITAGLLIYTTSTSNNTLYKILNTKYKILILAGILIGIALIFKTVAVFDFGAFVVFLFISKFNYRKHQMLRFMKRFIFNEAIPFLAGFLFPLFLTILYFLIHNALFDYIKTTLFYGVGYVGYENNFIIPQGLILVKLIPVIIMVLILFMKRKTISKETLFILLWLSFSVFNAFFSQRPYTHYLLVVLPSFCLLIGLAITAQQRIMKVVMITLAIGILLLVSRNFKLYGFGKTLSYYQNTISFIYWGEDVTAYQAFFDIKTPRDYELASFIKMHAKTDDTIFVWGDDPQIYALCNKLPPGKYTAAYHILYKQEREETQLVLQKTKPRYIITLAETSNIPFRLENYKTKYMLKGSVIYERTY